MLEPVYRTSLLLAQIVACLPIGTNQGIFHLLWIILSGKLLSNRGALFPALQEAGLTDQQSRRAEAALRVGKVTIARLLYAFTQLVLKEKRATLATRGEWNPLLIDWVGFYRPHLKGCVTKHFASSAGKALPAIELGMIARCLTVGNRRIPLLEGLVRSGDTLSLLKAARVRMRDKDVLIADRQVKIKHIEQTNIRHFVIRGAVDFTAREKELPKRVGRGRPATYGQIVRPLARLYRGKRIEATLAHRTESFVYQERVLTAWWFENLVLKECSLCFHCVIIRDPRYTTPWVLLTDLEESAETIFLLYRSRWKIEQLPQTGKQLLGGHRSFVHGDESRYRLPELCLFAASLALYLSATSHVVSTGFWDRHPKATSGRFRRVLSVACLPQMELIQCEYLKLADFDGKVSKLLSRVRVKASVFEHLPLGVLANRRFAGQRRQLSITGK